MALPTKRSYSGAADSCTLTGAISAGDTSATLTGTVTNWPSTGTGPFHMVIDPGLAAEEKVLVSARSSGSITTMSRGQDGTTAAAHAVGAVCFPVGAAVDFDEANSALSKMTTKGDLLVTTGSVYARLGVGTDTYALLADSTAVNGVAWGQIAAGGIATGAVTSAKILDDTIVNADINSAAAIAYSKLNLGTSIVNADVSTSAAIALSKLATTGTMTATTFVGALTGTASGNLVSGGALGTPSSGTLTNCTFPTLNQNTTGSAGSAPYSGLTGAVPTWNQNTTGSSGSTTGSSASCTGNAATASDSSLLGGFSESSSTSASTIARRDTSSNIYASQFIATNGTSQFYSTATETYIGANCARVINSSTVYSQAVSGRTVLVSTAGTLGNTTSSRRYKENIVAYNDETNKLLTVNPVTFDYKEGHLPEDEQEDRYNQFGLIAEDLHDAGLAHLVYYNAEAQPEAINYTMLSVELLGIVKKQQAALDELTTRVQALEA